MGFNYYFLACTMSSIANQNRAATKIQAAARMFLAKVFVMQEHGWWLGCAEEHEQDLLLLAEIMEEQRAHAAPPPVPPPGLQLTAEAVIRALFPEDLVVEGVNDVRMLFAGAPE